MAHASGIAEILLPVLLVLGLGTRLAAAGLLVMTAIIQITIPDGWANFHLPWAAMATALLAYRRRTALARPRARTSRLI